MTMNAAAVGALLLLLPALASCKKIGEAVAEKVGIGKIEPNEGKFVFSYWKDGNSEIGILDDNGENLKNLTTNPAKDYYPRVSPDGAKIAFVSERDSPSPYTPNMEIYVMGIDGSNPANISQNAGSEPQRGMEDSQPSWSPDGSKIAFVSHRDFRRLDRRMNMMYVNTEIYSMNADGSNVTRLTNNEAEDSDPQWSPDGKKIAFISVLQDRNSWSVKHYSLNLLDMNWSEPAVTPLIQGEIPLGHVVWSPDGSKIAYVSYANSASSLDVIDVNTMASTLVSGAAQGMADNYTVFHSPIWSSDGSQILYAADNDDAFISNSDGSNTRRALNMNGYKVLPAWSPSGKWMAIAAMPAKGMEAAIARNAPKDICLFEPGTDKIHPITKDLGLVTNDSDIPATLTWVKHP